MNTQTLYRPVGVAELELIIASGMRGFPPRRPEQPIFYPVLNETYARQIACDWNTKDEASGFAGFVTAFDMEVEYLSRFEPRQVGGKQHLEYWIPAEELKRFNEHLRGRIRMTESFFGERYAGPDARHWAEACSGKEQGS